MEAKKPSPEISAEVAALMEKDPQAAINLLLSKIAELKRLNPDAKYGLIGSVKIVCKDKDGNVKWIVEAADQEVKNQN